jgi:drug/metabolite transporter (DMT)-like permease
MQSHFASIVMLLVTMVIWGSTFVVTKGINDQVQPFTLAFVRVAIGALVLLACALVRQARGGTHARWSTLPWGTMTSMALIGVVLYYAVFNYSLVYTSAAQGALVQSCIALDWHRTVDDRSADRVLRLGGTVGRCEPAR